MTEGNSRSVTSNQPGIHEKLDEVVQKHLASEFKKPYAEHSIEAFKLADEKVQQCSGPIILDACCGVGESTAYIAAKNPDCFVVGVDKSAHRIDKHQDNYHCGGDNYLVLRADLNDIWRMAVEHGWRERIKQQWILYPNPWPKSMHLKRRWHAAGVFPFIVALGGELKVRSNWKIYIEEFQRALQLANKSAVVNEYLSEEAMTPFERKYWASGQQSWQLECQL